MTYWPLIRKLLFKMPPERAHHLSLAGLNAVKHCGLGICFKARPQIPKQVMGLDFPNPIGLAAGLDKNGDYIDGLGLLGFGSIEVGTVTPRPQVGNPAPRLFRLPEHQALINRMGFNNKGVDYLVERLKRRRYTGILGVNLGKNKDTPLERAAVDYMVCLQKVIRYADYITINISSPNTPGLRHLQTTSHLQQLLSHVVPCHQQLQDEVQRKVPLLIKLAPDLTEQDIQHIAPVLVEQHIDGVIATNTTVDHRAVQGHPYESEQGGLSGAPLQTTATHILKLLVNELRGAMPVIGVGGISDVEQALAKFKAGADLIQLYTGFIYQGPSFVHAIARALEQQQAD